MLKRATRLGSSAAGLATNLAVDKEENLHIQTSNYNWKTQNDGSP